MRVAKSSGESLVCEREELVKRQSTHNHRDNNFVVLYICNALLVYSDVVWCAK